MKTTLNSIIDVSHLLDTRLDGDAVWEASVQATEAMGYSALNIVSFGSQDLSVNWFRSSMQTAWLEDYVTQDFMTIDPFLISSIQGRDTIRLTSGRVQDIGELSDKSPDLADQMVSWGYAEMDFQAFRDQNLAQLRGVSLGHGDGPGPMPDDSQRLLCGVLSMANVAPQSPDSPGANPFLGVWLTTRERDVLRYLTCGLRNDEIAFRMRLAEVTVRAHIASARAKLGAATREEAVAKAIRAGLLDL